MNNDGQMAPIPQHGVFLGEVFGLEDDPAFGVVARVRLSDAREVDARAVFVGARGLQGRYDPMPDSGTAIVFMPEGSAASAVAIVGIQTSGAPSDYNGSKTVAYGLEEHRATEGATVGGVLVRALLDDLSALVGAMQAMLTTLTNPLTPPGTATQNAAILTALRTLADFPETGTKAVIDPIKVNLDTSKAGSGTAPHCSGILRAQAGGS